MTVNNNSSPLRAEHLQGDVFILFSPGTRAGHRSQFPIGAKLLQFGLVPVDRNDLLLRLMIQHGLLFTLGRCHLLQFFKRGGVGGRLLRIAQLFQHLLHQIVVFEEIDAEHVRHLRVEIHFNFQPVPGLVEYTPKEQRPYMHPDHTAQYAAQC